MLQDRYLKMCAYKRALSSLVDQGIIDKQTAERALVLIMQIERGDDDCESMHQGPKSVDKYSQ